MSAPLVVNTTDGTVWLRRAATRGGVALYAPADVCSCPEFVMATEAELAEHGIAGSADVLPVPVGPQGEASDGEYATIAALIGNAKPATTAFVVSLAEAVRDVREHEHPKWEDLYCQNLLMWLGERMAPVLRRLLDAEARVAELEAERHTTNEALDDAVQELRARRDDEPTTDTLPAWLHWRFGKHGQRWDSLDADDQSYWERHAEAVRRAVARNGFKPGGNDAALALGADVPPLRGRALLDALTVERAERAHNRRLGIEDPHDSPLHHTYRQGRDMPELGGATC